MSQEHASPKPETVAEQEAGGGRRPSTCSPSSTPETAALREKLFPNTWEESYWAMKNHAEKLERERNGARSALDAFRDRIEALETAIHETIMENLHLADGDVCTLKRLKDAIGFELPPENAELRDRSGSGTSTHPKPTE